MRIIHVVHAYPPAIGGIETHVRSLAEEQAKLGNQVKVITTGEPGAPAREKHGKLTIERHFAIRFPFFSSIRWIPFLALRLMLEDTDVYCSHGYGSLMPACTALAALVKGKPFIFSLHGYPRLKGIGAVLQSFYKLILANFFLRAASKIISVGSASMPFMLDTVRISKITVVPNGVDTKKFRTEESIADNRSKKILYVGRLDTDKGIDRLIRAVSFANSKGAGLAAKIVGKDEGIRHSLAALANELGVSAEFRLVPYERVQEEYERSLAFVLPSRYEGMSLVFMEAVACERPAFSTKVGDVPGVAKQVYGKDAGFFIFHSDSELAQKLLEVSRNRKKFAAIMKSARSRLEKKMSWHAVAQRTIKVYGEALGKGQ